MNDLPPAYYSDVKDDAPTVARQFVAEFFDQQQDPLARAMRERLTEYIEIDRCKHYVVIEALVNDFKDLTQEFRDFLAHEKRVSARWYWLRGR